MLEDNAWLGGSVSYAEKNLELARVNFQTQSKKFMLLLMKKYQAKAMEHKEYEVGEKTRYDRIQIIILLYELDKLQPL